MSSLLAAELALLEWGLVCGRVRRDLGLSARQHLVRRDESDGAVAACLQGGSDANVGIDCPLSRTLSTSSRRPRSS